MCIVSIGQTDSNAGLPNSGGLLGPEDLAGLTGSSANLLSAQDLADLSGCESFDAEAEARLGRLRRGWGEAKVESS